MFSDHLTWDLAIHAQNFVSVRKSAFLFYWFVSVFSKEKNVNVFQFWNCTGAGFFSDGYRPTRVQWYRHHHCFSSERYQPAGKTAHGFSVGTQGLWKHCIIYYSSSCFSVFYSVEALSVSLNYWILRGSKYQSWSSELAGFAAVAATTLFAGNFVLTCLLTASCTLKVLQVNALYLGKWNFFSFCSVFHILTL